MILYAPAKKIARNYTQVSYLLFLASAPKNRQGLPLFHVYELIASIPKNFARDYPYFVFMNFLASILKKKSPGITPVVVFLKIL